MACEIKMRSDFWGFEVLGYLRAFVHGVPTPNSVNLRLICATSATESMEFSHHMGFNS